MIYIFCRKKIKWIKNKNVIPNAFGERWFLSIIVMTMYGHTWLYKRSNNEVIERIMKGSAEMVAQEEAIIQAGICQARFNILHAGSTRTGRHAIAITIRSCGRELDSDTPRAHRANHRSWWNNELPKRVRSSRIRTLNRSFGAGTADGRRDTFDARLLIDRRVRVSQPVPRYQSHDRTK